MERVVAVAILMLDLVMLPGAGGLEWQGHEWREFVLQHRVLLVSQFPGTTAG